MSHGIAYWATAYAYVCLPKETKIKYIEMWIPQGGLHSQHKLLQFQEINIGLDHVRYDDSN